ncbi:methyltransferase domain-containing protein [Phthorimaea operculella]|nr:methyltransferase domain-containing protein [Phthorimaea operculella]
MFQPELYGKSNSVPFKDALACLKQFAPKWRERCRVLDLGSGDGVVTSRVLRPCLPADFSMLVGADISPEMVAYANTTHGDRRCKFIELDMAGEVPKELVATFDHVFSSYALHWTREQEKTFSNIHNLLTEGGSCLLQFCAYTRVHDYYRVLAKHPKWQSFCTNIENYISPYQDSQEPDKEVHAIMANVGFKNIRVEREDKTYLYDEKGFRGQMLSIFPNKIPADLIDEFMDDYLQVARELKMAETADGDTTYFVVDNSLIVAIGSVVLKFLYLEIFDSSKSDNRKDPE